MKRVVTTDDSPAVLTETQRSQLLALKDRTPDTNDFRKPLRPTGAMRAGSTGR